MGRREKNKMIENLEILDVAAEGKSIARFNEKVVFLAYTAPGDVVDARITKARSKFYEAVPVKFHQYSDQRVDPVCEHYGICGGCKWQHLDYEKQLFYKQKQVKDNFERIGKLDFPEIKPIIGSLETTLYRNKMEYTFTDQSWLTIEEVKSGEEFERRGLGFHVPGQFDKILDIEKCHLQIDISNKIRNSLRDFARKNDIPFFSVRNKTGLLRTMMVRTANTGDLMVVVQFYYRDKETINMVMNHLKGTFPQISSLMYVVNEKANDTLADQDIILFKGEDFIREEMEGLTFKVGPKSFYQTNAQQAYELYKVTRDFAALTGEEHVYDLYTGTGTIANFVAKSAKYVVGVEYVEAAIEDAKVNSEINKIDNTSFYAGDMKDVLNARFIENNGQPDVVIVDPPRAGMHTDVTETLLRMEAQRIVYVSCNPATQARDLELLQEKYDIAAVQPVDMFPHTHHVENVVRLELKK